MWTLENRPKYNRDHLRYPSDLTDDEWAYIKPLIPPAKPGGGKRRTDMRAVMNGVMYILSTVANGATCRRIFRRTARPTATSSGGNAMVCWIASITCSTSHAARRRNEKPAPPPPLSIAKA